MGVDVGHLSWGALLASSRSLSSLFRLGGLRARFAGALRHPTIRGQRPQHANAYINLTS